MINTLDSDAGTLDKNSPVFVEFAVSKRVDLNTVGVSVLFRADGLRQLRPDGYVKINGRLLKPKAIRKQGFWYQMNLPAADRYELVYQRSANTQIIQHIVVPRVFEPTIPQRFSNVADLIVPYHGPPIMETELVYIDVGSPASVEPSKKWRTVLHAVVEGNKLRIPADELRALSYGEAVLYVGLAIDKLTPHRSGSKLTYQIGRSVSVEISK